MGVWGRESPALGSPPKVTTTTGTVSASSPSQTQVVARAALAHAESCAAASVWLGVNQNNGRAQRFYAKHGFAAVGAPEPMNGPWAGLHEQLMVRRLPHDGGAA